jgi:Flp pilus assembly protein TadG
MISFIRQKRGQSVVELALVLPLLLLVLFGITEFGRAWMTQNVLTSAAREGARLAVVTAPDVGLVTARVTANGELQLSDTDGRTIGGVCGYGTDERVDNDAS